MANDQVDWGNFFKSLGTWEGWNTPQKWLGPDTQAALGGMAKAVNPYGISGNVGEMFKNYVQGIGARESFNKRMLQNKRFLEILPQLLGGGLDQKNVGPLADSLSKYFGTSDPYNYNPYNEQFTSKNW